jgi:hypothetical protein
VLVLPLSVAALVACAVLLLLLAGGSAARRGQFTDADPSALRGGGDDAGRGDLHRARPRDGRKGLRVRARQLPLGVPSIALGPPLDRDSEFPEFIVWTSHDVHTPPPPTGNLEFI